MALVVAAIVDLGNGGNVGWVVGTLRLSEKSKQLSMVELKSFIYGNSVFSILNQHSN